jgi:hypothetical protein
MKGWQGDWECTGDSRPWTVLDQLGQATPDAENLERPLMDAGRAMQHVAARARAEGRQRRSLRAYGNVVQCGPRVCCSAR